MTILRDNLLNDNNHNECKLSVIISAFNEEVYIERCIQSVDNNTFDKEIIVIDDGSTDKTSEILDRLQKRYSSLRIITNERQMGLGFSRNLGIQKSKGKYLMFVDGDDELSANVSRELIPLCEENDLEVCFFDLEREVLGEKTWCRYLPDISKNTPVIKGRDLLDDIISRGTIAESACRQVIRRQFLNTKDISFLENTLSEDALFSLRLFLYAERVIYVAKPYYVYHKNQGSMTFRYTDTDYFVCRCEDMYEFLHYQLTKDQKDLPRFFTKYIRSRMDVLNSLFHSKDAVIASERVEKHSAKAKAVYDMFFDPQNKRILSDINHKTISDYGSVIIYGTGKMGKQLYEEIKHEDIVIKGFAVSEEYLAEPDTRHSLFGFRVDAISAFEIGQDDLIVIAMLPHHADAVRKRLERDGYNNYLLLGDEE